MTCCRPKLTVWPVKLIYFSDNLQLPCEQPPTASYKLQIPHVRHGHPGGHSNSGHGDHGGLDMVVMSVMVVVVNRVVLVDRTGQDKTDI